MNRNNFILSRRKCSFQRKAEHRVLQECSSEPRRKGKAHTPEEAPLRSITKHHQCGCSTVVNHNLYIYTCPSYIILGECLWTDGQKSLSRICTYILIYKYVRFEPKNKYLYKHISYMCISVYMLILLAHKTPTGPWYQIFMNISICQRHSPSTTTNSELGQIIWTS